MFNFLAEFAMKLIVWLHGIFSADKTSEDAKKQPDLKRDLLDRIDRMHDKQGDLRPPRRTGTVG